MKATNTNYNLDASLKRIDGILDANQSYPDKKSVPSRDDLSYTNGFYADCTAIFVDICGSSDMTDERKRPTLAKMYRSFISEMVAMFNGFSECKEISINGDCVWAVFDTPNNDAVNVAFDAACKARSLTHILDYKFKKKSYSSIKANVGMDYGRALVVQAGFKGSAINDVIWMGDVVNSACHLCNESGARTEGSLLLSSNVYNKLKKEYQALCRLLRFGVYESTAVNIELNDWLKDQKNKDNQRRRSIWDIDV